MSDNKKRVAWITGGGSGIGLAGAEALAKEGWQVVISGRRQDVIDEAVAGIVKVGGKAEALALDVSSAADADKVAKAILAKHGRIDLLVNSAGLNVPKRNWDNVSLEGWDQVIDINLNGLMYCMYAVQPAMVAQKGGTIINIASWAGHYISKLTGPAYVATKHAVVALTHSFNVEQFQTGVRACCISPAEVATPIMKKRPVPPSAEDMARMLQPADLGRTISFIANMPPHVCVNEIIISPTWNRAFN
jgi:NADP-dependent 3-hydroxy acid dehydrogenase YdfG